MRFFNVELFVEGFEWEFYYCAEYIDFFLIINILWYVLWMIKYVYAVLQVSANFGPSFIFNLIRGLIFFLYEKN